MSSGCTSSFIISVRVTKITSSYVALLFGRLFVGMLKQAILLSFIICFHIRMKEN